MKKAKVDHQKIKRRRDQKLARIRSERKDGNKDNVIINETRDKKFKKYMVQNLPFPYKSKGQYEQIMNMPLGKWNTEQGFKRMIQPDLLTKAGKIIAPLKYKKNISLKSIETLFQNSKNPRKAVAKF